MDKLLRHLRHQVGFYLRENNKCGALGFGSQNANDVQPNRKLTREEEERESRRQRRWRRRSDCQNMFPQTMTVNTRKDTVSIFVAS